jgi:glycerol-3-phosphate O-acyltransferase
MLTEVQSRVVDALVRSAQSGGRPLDEVLADSVYHELRRLKEDAPSKARAEARAFWEEIRRGLARSNARALQEFLGKVVERYAGEICGNFDERVYQLATRALPPAMAMLLNSVSPKRVLGKLPQLPSLDDTVIVQGEVSHLRSLHERGTVIVTPTHVSNLDSVILGYAIYRLGLPPLVYGAGLNLFSNPLIGFFMRHLGAYTVDRRKHDPLYKEVLKEYATLTLEYGYDNLFFPGGTRSRSGAVERYLKLGLLGASVPAFINNVKRGAARQKIFIIPATMSYQLVLEAETLVDDFLKEVGKARYIITDDEFSRPRTVVDFAAELLRLDSRIYLTVGRGCDPFGNPVDDDGVSLDPRGRSIDIRRYVMKQGELVADAARDMEYTREVGERLITAFAKDNVVQSTHIVARALFVLLLQKNRSTDLVRLLRVGGTSDDVGLAELYREVDRLLTQLRAMALHGSLRLAPGVQTAPSDDVVSDALRHFACFHSAPAATRRGDRIFATERNLLFYYQNRLEGYGLEQAVGLSPALSKNHRSLRSAA